MLLVPRIAWVIYMRSYFSLRPFLTSKFFQEIWGWRGQKFLGEKKTFLTRKFSGKISSPKISSGTFGSNSPSRGNFEAQNFLETRGNFRRKFWNHLIIELKSVPFPSTGWCLLRTHNWCVLCCTHTCIESHKRCLKSLDECCAWQDCCTRWNDG